MTAWRLDESRTAISQCFKATHETVLLVVTNNAISPKQSPSDKSEITSFSAFKTAALPYLKSKDLRSLNNSS